MNPESLPCHLNGLGIIL